MLNKELYQSDESSSLDLNLDNTCDKSILPSTKSQKGKKTRKKEAKYNIS